MSRLAPILQGFFTDRLVRQRQASPHTVAAYRDSLRLLLVYAAQRDRQAARRRWTSTDLDAAADRGVPGPPGDRAGQQRAHPQRPAGRGPVVVRLRRAARTPTMPRSSNGCWRSRPSAATGPSSDYLTAAETDALLAAPDRGTWLGRRDHALLTLAVQTGLRVSELTGLRVHDLHLGPGAHVRCHGKGRKNRITPLTRPTVTVLRAWLSELAGQPDDRRVPHPPPTSRCPATPSSDSSPSTTPPPARP